MKTTKRHHRSLLVDITTVLALAMASAIATLATVVPTVVLGLAVYIFHRFVSRISPSVPYVGEGS
jgi:uncharacterized membrane-anchored protein